MHYTRPPKETLCVGTNLIFSSLPEPTRTYNNSQLEHIRIHTMNLICLNLIFCNALYNCFIILLIIIYSYCGSPNTLCIYLLLYYIFPYIILLLLHFYNYYFGGESCLNTFFFNTCLLSLIQ